MHKLRKIEKKKRERVSERERKIERGSKRVRE
jgi:hypothetical protein